MRLNNMKSIIKTIRIIIMIILLLMIITINNKVQAAGVDGAIIVLNPGHGGSYTGCANGALGLIEKNITLKIGNYLRQELSKYYGVNIIMTHDGVNFPNNDSGDLAARAMIARNNNADLYVSLHINDNNSTEVNGANVYVTSRTELPKYKEGMTRLGNMILANLNKLGIKNNGVINNMYCNDREPKFQYYDGSQADYYGDIRYAMKGDTDGYGPDFSDGSGISTVLIEHCFMNNSHDVQFLDSEEDLQNLAKADADAIVEYFGLRLKGTVVNNIELDKASANLVLGDSQTINVTKIEPTTATNKKINWTSSNENVARVDSTGKVTTLSEGQAVITATSDDNPNISKTVTINVEKEEVKILDEEIILLKDKNKTINVKITPSWIENKDISWLSDNEEIVTVDNNGKITGITEGNTTVTVTWNDKNLSDTVNINVLDIEDATIEINNYTETDNKISKIGPNAKIEDFLQNIVVSDNLEIQVTPVNNEQTIIGTNTKVTIIEKNSNVKVAEYYCLIYADVNGDGKISALDYTLIKNHIMDVKKITDGNQILAANVNGDEKISALDYTLIKNHIMDVKKIPLK